MPHPSSSPPRASGRALAWLLPLLLVAACEGEGPEGTGTSNGMSDGTGDRPLPPLATPHACSVQVSDIAVFQGVKIPLVVNGKPAATINAPIIEGRRAYFRAYVTFGDKPAAGWVRGRLNLQSSEGQWRFDADVQIDESSQDSDLKTTLNFDVPGERMHGNLAMSLELEVGSTCADGGRVSYPNGGLLALPLVNTGTLKIHLLPVAYDADKSGRLPDTSDTQLTRYYDVLMASYPVSKVELTVRNPVRSTIPLSSGDGWGMFLDSIRSQRSSDRVGNDVHYYALVAPAKTFSAYCSNACIAGLSYLADTPSALKMVGAGVGFSGPVPAETLVHEVGHQHGRGHSPCGTKDGTDKQYPYEGAFTGVWGFDVRNMSMVNPAQAHDVMSYCEPWWISDYTYAAIADRRQTIVQLSGARIYSPTGKGALTVDGFRGFRSLLTGLEGGRVVWGGALPGDFVPEGQPEVAKALDGAGRAVADVLVYRNTLGHAAGSVQSYDVPVPQAGWVSLQIAGQPSIRFSDPVGVPALQAMAPIRER